MKLRSLFSWSIAGIFACIPLFFLPLTQDYYDTNKWFLLIGITLILISYTLFQLVKTRHITLSISPTGKALGALSILAIISMVFVSPNKIEALLTLFGPITWICICAISFILPPLLSQETRKRFMMLMYVSVSFVALLSIYQLCGLGKVMFPKILYLANPLWTPTGSSVATLTLFAILLPRMISDSLATYKQKHETKSIFLIVATITVAIGLGLTAWQLISRIPGTLLPLRDGWAILLEIVKNPKHALLGVGAENFLTAFSSGRLQSYNVSPLWSVRFTTNANLPFHITTIYGLIGGLISLLWIKTLFSPRHPKAHLISLIISVIALFITPPNLTIFIVVTSLLLFSESSNAHTISVRFPSHTILRGILGMVSVLCVGAGVYGIARAYSAEYYFYQSLQMATQNNGSQTYNLQIKAMEYNPYIGRYHTTYSQTNLVLATTLGNTTIQADPPLSDDEKAKNRDLVAQLIQQSIREAKIGVKLNPSDILAWENLARTYLQLIDVAQGADTWAIASFQEAIHLDPNNPTLRIELGSLYLRAKNYTEAITQFQKSISLKPDYANAYYNLANAYTLSGDTQSAIQTLKQTQRLLDPKSTDYAKVTQEIQQLENGQAPQAISIPQEKNPSVTR